MDKVSLLFQEPVFWVGTVVVGILLNVLTTYLVRALDRGTFAWSKWAERRSERSRAQHQQLRATASTDRGLILLISRASRYRAKSMWGMAMGALMIAAGAYVQSISDGEVLFRVILMFGVLMNFIGLLFHADGVRIERVLRELERESGLR